MIKDTLIIGDIEVRVACNMNALLDFAKETGNDDFAALSNITKLKPSDMLPLIAACVREGERLEGRECSLTAKDIGAVAGFGLLTDFMGIFGRAMAPVITVEDEKK